MTIAPELLERRRERHISRDLFKGTPCMCCGGPTDDGGTFFELPYDHEWFGWLCDPCTDAMLRARKERM